ncbi:MAG: hypothetical protein ACRD3Y_07740, partial [Bryobacteraceae bacterium]
TKTSLPQSHRLHYLQMWMEKLCKASVYTENIESLKNTHNVVAKILPRLIQEHWGRIGLERRPRIAEIQAICKEIDLLHPQIDSDGRRPDNVEYPWNRPAGEVAIPALWKFPLSARLNSPGGRLLLKAASRLTGRLATPVR